MRQYEKSKNSATDFRILQDVSCGTTVKEWTSVLDKIFRGEANAMLCNKKPTNKEFFFFFAKKKIEKVEKFLIYIEVLLITILHLFQRIFPSNQCTTAILQCPKDWLTHIRTSLHVLSAPYSASIFSDKGIAKNCCMPVLNCKGDES